MLLFCVRVSCQDKILYGPKWISIEETGTLCDVLRCATGDKYLSRRLKVVVASEKSLRDLSFVKLGLPVVILDKNDKKIVSFLLKPEDAVITPPAPERKLSIQSTQQVNSDEDDRRSGTPDQEILMYHGVHSPHSPHSQFHPAYPHYPYMAPMYHHPPPVMCHCPSCTGHRPPVHSPHGTAPGSFVHHQMGPHAGWTHGSPTAFHVRPRLQRPMSAPSEKLEMLVKGSPLYGQPPWWGWGSSDDEIYNYPNTATILEGGDSQTAGQQALSLKKKKITKKDALEMAQRRHSIGTVSVLSESKARIVTTRTSNTTYDPEQERAMKQREEFVVFQKKSSLPSPGYSEQLSPVFENSTSKDWEMPSARNEQAERDSSSSTENSPDDGSEGHSRLGSSYEIPFIPDYDEVPERPVSLKSDKGKIAPQDVARKGSAEKQDRVVRKKPTSKVKKRVTASDAPAKNGKLASSSRKHSSDTSESEYEPSSHPSRRSGVIAVGTATSSSGVFGLTEVSLGDQDRRETLSPALLPSWVQQWANSPDNRGSAAVQPIEVFGSSEDSTASSVMSSSSQIPVPVEPDNSENNVKPVKSVSSPSLSRPRSASSRTNTPGVMRSQSLSSANLSSSPKTSASPRVSRSKTMTAAVRRSYPAATSSESDKKPSDSVRRRGPVSSTSDDSDVESSDASQTRHIKDSRRKSDESDRRGVQLIPEKEGKRPFSAPRPNKTAMLRAHNSREAVKNSGVKSKTPISAKARTTKSSPPSNSGNGSGGAVNHRSDSARVWSPSTKRSSKSSTGDDNREVGENGIKSDGDDLCSSPANDVTQEAVDDVFTSGPVRPLPESLQMKRDDTVNKTFVLDEGNEDVSVSSPEDSSMQAWEGKVSNTEHELESKDLLDKSTLPSSPSSKEPKEIKLESTNTRGISLRSKLIPFAPFLETQSYTPPVSDQPFEPPSDSAESADSSGSRSSTAEGRPMSPESVVSMATGTSPSPPLTPSSAARKMFDFKGGAASSQSRRQWGVTDKPVEDLMLSSIHAFSVELRLASESVLSKVKSLYDGSEELNGTTRSRTDSDSKQESQSALPDWKSSHAEIAGIFRNLRKVELRLRTMEQALSIMCVAAQKEPKNSFQDRKLSMVETSSLASGQKWRELKIRARRNSWAVEHRNQFPVPPAESDEDDEDTS
ncbi:uncharacterized protein LOC144634544 isoform X2 [Oculina patagonica]